MIVLDTNVLSEVLKPVPSQPVAEWMAAQETTSLFLTTITVAEILTGIETMPQGRRRTELLAAVEKEFVRWFDGRILVFDEPSARAYAGIVAGRKRAGRLTTPFDIMIAAIAQVRGAAVATRNVPHFQDFGVQVINPWNS